MATTHALAHMHARLGEFDLTRSLAARCREIADASGQRSRAAALAEVEADVERLAGNHDLTERILATSCDWFTAIDAPHVVLEALRGLALAAGGRQADVERLGGFARGLTDWTGALLHPAMASTHLSARRLDDAAREAHTAVDYIATTGFITFHADGRMIFGDVLRARGRDPEADASYRAALDLYRQKGSTIGVAIETARLGTSPSPQRRSHQG